jgi:hypothetical protein
VSSMTIRITALYPTSQGSDVAIAEVEFFRLA